MRRTPSRHALARVPSRLQRLQPLQSLQLRRQNKPYGFCCEEQAQDPEKRYDLRNPPFASSLTDVILDSGGPAVKFRVRDVGRPPYPIQRRILEVKGAAYLGRCERCRGPLRWYLEDEIELARQFLAKERRDRYDEDVKRNLKIAKRKGFIALYVFKRSFIIFIS